LIHKTQMIQTKQILLLVVFTVVLVVGCQQDYNSKASNSITGQAVKEFNTVISGYQYNPSSITVNLGDTVRISVKNNDNTGHGVSLPSFGIQEFVGPGETKTIQFVANKRGQPVTFCRKEHGEELEVKVI